MTEAVGFSQVHRILRLTFDFADGGIMAADEKCYLSSAGILETSRNGDLQRNNSALSTSASS